MRNPEEIDAMRNAMSQGPLDRGTLAEDVVHFLLEHLDDAQLADVLQRLAPRQPARSQARAAASTTRIACLGARSIKLIPLSEVEYVKSSLAGVHAVTPAGEFFTELTLAALESDLSFIRCHKQYLVNVECIDEIDLACLSVASIRTRSGFCVPVGRRYRHRLKAALRI